MQSMFNAGNLCNANTVSQCKNIFKIFIVKTFENLQRYDNDIMNNGLLLKTLIGHLLGMRCKFWLESSI